MALIDKLIDLTWHLPLSVDDALFFENKLISLHMSQELYEENVLSEGIYNLIHYNGNPELYATIFIEHLDDMIDKNNVFEDLSGTDIFDASMLYDFINKYIMHIYKQPTG